MKSIITALISALVGAAVAAIGLVTVAIPAILLWLVTYEAASDPELILSGITGSWLLGHGVPLEFHVSAESALGLGAEASAVTLPISLPLLGMAVITVIGGVQLGWKSTQQLGNAVSGITGGTIGFGVVATLAAGTAQPVVSTNIGWAIGKPTLFFVVAVAVGIIWRGIATHGLWHTVAERISAAVSWGTRVVAWAGVTGQLVVALLAAMVGLSALAFVFTLALNFTEVVRIGESLQLDGIGTLLLAIVQILLLPIALIWSLVWLSGSGFHIGQGTSLSPFEQLLGPVPAFPLFGALPQSWGAVSLFAPMFVVLVAIIVGAMFGGKSQWRTEPWWHAAIAAAVAAGSIGLVFAGLAGLARGALGPGRLTVNGPDVGSFTLTFTLEMLCGLVAGVLVRRLDGYWVRPITDTVVTRRDRARQKREEEWAMLGKPETFEGLTYKDREQQLVSEFDTVSYETDDFEPNFDADTDAYNSDIDNTDADDADAQGTDAIVTDAFAFGLRQGGQAAHTEYEYGSELDDVTGEATDETQTSDISENAQTGPVQETGPVNNTGWFDELHPEDNVGSGATSHVEGKTHRDSRSTDGEDTDEVAEADAQLNDEMAELTDPDAIAKAFAWDAKSTQSEKPQKRSRWPWKKR
jgi:hypothetical protein